MTIMILYLAIGLFLGAIIGWVFARLILSSKSRSDSDIAQKKYTELEIQFATIKATSENQIHSFNAQIEDKNKVLIDLEKKLNEKILELDLEKNQSSSTKALLSAANNTLEERKETINTLEADKITLTKQRDENLTNLATANANNFALNEKLSNQKQEIEELSKKFNTEFENIANKILETKAAKFTDLNKTNLKDILEPLGKNIDEFKRQVNETYDKESKERFSLGAKVKELADLNKKISEEAQNLTKALKGEAKTQGRWGEMILESVLEKSGLVKNREYFMEHQLLDSEGKPLKSDSEDKKMRPDAVIKYPDNRSVIIDSKVSLNAFTRLLAATDVDEQNKELEAHVSAIKNHIVTLSEKGYDDYDKALDFVMMFIPSEPAYIAALQGDADLWNFAYDKRILLLSPTNLITSLKLIVDLWKREYQNENALAIAERGGKLFDKFVGFVDDLKEIGSAIKKADKSYEEAYKKLSTGNDNLVLQTDKLKKLGVKTKKSLPGEFNNALLATDESEDMNEG